MCWSAGSLDWSAPHLRTSAPCIHWNNKLTQRAARLWAVAKPSESTLPKWGLIFQSVSLSCAQADPAPVFLCVLYVRELVSERAVETLLERSRSRLWLNSLFGESHVPGELRFHSFSFQLFTPSYVWCLLLTFNLWGHNISPVSFL